MSLSPNLERQPQGISYQEREGGGRGAGGPGGRGAGGPGGRGAGGPGGRGAGGLGGKLQAVHSDTVEAAFCDHFGTDINW